MGTRLKPVTGNQFLLQSCRGSQRTVTSRLWGHTLPPSGTPSGQTGRFQLPPAGISPPGLRLHETQTLKQALSPPSPPPWVRRQDAPRGPGRTPSPWGAAPGAAAGGPRAQPAPVCLPAGPVSGERFGHFETVGKNIRRRIRYCDVKRPCDSHVRVHREVMGTQPRRPVLTCAPGCWRPQGPDGARLPLHSAGLAVPITQAGGQKCAHQF